MLKEWRRTHRQSQWWHHFPALDFSSYWNSNMSGTAAQWLCDFIQATRVHCQSSLSTVPKHWSYRTTRHFLSNLLESFKSAQSLGQSTASHRSGGRKKDDLQLPKSGSHLEHFLSSFFHCQYQWAGVWQWCASYKLLPHRLLWKTRENYY